MSTVRTVGTFTPHAIHTVDEMKAYYAFCDVQKTTQGLSGAMQALDEQGADRLQGQPGRVAVDTVDIGGRPLSGTCDFDPASGRTETLQVESHIAQSQTGYDKKVDNAWRYEDHPEQETYVSHRLEQVGYELGTAIREETLDDVTFVVDKKTGVVAFDMVHGYDVRQGP